MGRVPPSPTSSGAVEDEQSREIRMANPRHADDADQSVATGRPRWGKRRDRAHGGSVSAGPRDIQVERSRQFAHVFLRARQGFVRSCHACQASRPATSRR